MYALMIKFLAETRGATAIEYALIAAGVALAIATIVYALGDEVFLMYGDVEDALAD